MTTFVPNRYNSLGDWKPLVYAGNFEAIEAEAVSLSTDPYIQGTLLYGLATGHLIALVNEVDEEIVSSRLPQIANISHEFLIRVISKSRSEPLTGIPAWSQLSSIGISMDDPRSTLITNNLEMVQRRGWAIKPEWCD